MKTPFQHVGFLIVGFFWLFVAFVIYATRKSVIKKPDRNWMIEKVMNGNSDNY